MQHFYNLNLDQNNGADDRGKPFLLSAAQQLAIEGFTKSLRRLENQAMNMVTIFDLHFDVVEITNRLCDTFSQKLLRLVGIVPSGPAHFRVNDDGSLLSRELQEASVLEDAHNASREKVRTVFQGENPSTNARAKEYAENTLEAGQKKLDNILSLINSTAEICHSLGMASDQKTMTELRTNLQEVVSQYRKNLRA